MYDSIIIKRSYLAVFRHLIRVTNCTVSFVHFLCEESIQHTCENSRWLRAAFFRHVVTDVTGCVTRREQALHVQRAEL